MCSHYFSNYASSQVHVQKPIRHFGCLLNPRLQVTVLRDLLLHSLHSIIIFNTSNNGWNRSQSVAITPNATLITLPVWRAVEGATRRSLHVADVPCCGLMDTGYFSSQWPWFLLCGWHLLCPTVLHSVTLIPGMFRYFELGYSSHFCVAFVFGDSCLKRLPVSHLSVSFHIRMGICRPHVILWFLELLYSFRLVLWVGCVWFRVPFQPSSLIWKQQHICQYLLNESQFPEGMQLTWGNGNV